MSHKILNGEKIPLSIKNLKIGQNHPIIIAGPCSVESKEQILICAVALKKMGINVLRGGAFKPRTSPYSFQGLEEKGLMFLKDAAEKVNLPIITELMDPMHMDMILEYADIIQIGSRNMYNYSLLKRLGKTQKPILLKRGMSATFKEWILAAEYIASSGNKNIILCERGIRTFENHTRNTLDLSAVPIMKKETGLPIIVDPSHGTGIKDLVEPMSKAALACGADGIMVEVHPDPKKALSDGEQSLDFKEFENLLKTLKPYL